MQGFCINPSESENGCEKRDQTDKKKNEIVCCRWGWVLKREGKCLITFFLLNEESFQLIRSGKSDLNFGYDFGKYRTVDPNIPEAAIGYDEAFVLSLYGKYGLTIKPPLHYGSWCGRSTFLSYQDIVVASG